MSTLLAANAILMCRAELDDATDGKAIFSFGPLLGKQDGVNKNFQIPQSRVIIQNAVIYKNEQSLNVGTDFNWVNAKIGTLTFAVAPVESDVLTTSFTYTWFDDIEIDHHLNRAANDMGFSTYHTDAGDPTFEQIPIPPTTIPYGLIGALMYGGAARAAKALALRFGTAYDISAGDHNYSKSQMAKTYSDMAEALNKQFLNARDDFYKGQGQQYRPAQAGTGYVLPNFTPAR